MEVPEALASRTGSEAARIQELENEIMEFTLLDKHIKIVNEALQRTSEETRATCEKLTRMNTKLEKKNARMAKKARRLYKVVKSLRYKLATRRPKRKGYCRFEVLAEVADAAEGAQSGSEEL